jgi:hypothetical protein
VRSLFLKNPWGVGMDEIEADLEEFMNHDGLLTMTISPPDSETWTVSAQTEKEFKNQEQSRYRDFSDEDNNDECGSRCEIEEETTW